MNLPRVTGAYDYKRFCRELLGPGWVVFEIAFLTLLLLILSVIGSAAGTLATGFGISSLWGTSGLMLLIAVLVVPLLTIGLWRVRRAGAADQ